MAGDGSFNSIWKEDLVFPDLSNAECDVKSVTRNNTAKAKVSER